MTQLPLVALNRPLLLQYTFLPKNVLPDFVIQRGAEVVAAYNYFSFPPPRAQCYPLLHQHYDVMTCLDPCFYLWGMDLVLQRKERRLDTEIKRTQNAPFTSHNGNKRDMIKLCIEERLRSE